MARFAANLIDRPWSAIVRGGVPLDWITEALDGLPIRLLGSDAIPRDGSKAIERIEREIQMSADEHGVPPLAVIDYLQNLARGVSERDLRSRIGDLATLCRSHDAAVRQPADRDQLGSAVLLQRAARCRARRVRRPDRLPRRREGVR